MFDFVRKHTRILQLILVILILPSFVVFGIQGYSSFTSNDGVIAKVDGQKITQAEWDNAHRNLVERLRTERPDADPKMFDTPVVRKQALDSLIRQYVVARAARDQNLAPPMARIVRVFTSQPEFAAFRNADGTLNEKALEARGMTADRLGELLRQELTLGQVLNGVQATSAGSQWANRRAVESLFQVRDVQWTKLEPRQYAASLSPTEAQLKAYYNDPANAAMLMSPEKADVQYVMLDVESLKARVAVSEDDLKRSYQENIKLYTQPEERRASHILIKAEKSATDAERKAARAKAEGLLAQVRKSPALFAELAKKNSEDPGSATNGGDLDFFTRGAMVPPFEAAVFTAKPGQISDIVETDFGFHIIQLTAIRGGQAQPFEAVKARIEDEARKQLAQKQFAEAAEKFTNTVYEQSDSLKPVSDELKLPLQTQTDVLAQPGKKDQGALSNAHILSSLFDAANRAKGRNTEATEVGPNKLVSARIVKYSPAARLPFEQVQAELKAKWVQVESLKLAQADAMKKSEAWKADKGGDKLPLAMPMSRRTMFNQPPQVLDAVMRAPEKALPSIFTVDLGAEGVAVVKVNKVLPLEMTPQELADTESQFGGYWGKVEADAYLRALKRRYKVVLLNDALKLEEQLKPKAAEGAASKAG
jgi:peptidyl-prolyl cis-trans isomerase D